MPINLDFVPLELPLREELIIPEWKLFLPKPQIINILFITEGISFSRSDGFAFRELIDRLRDNTAISYANFKITLASWGNDDSATLVKNAVPGDYQATYSNYRFTHADPDSGNLILDEHDEVWLFGFAPGNNFPQTTASILSSSLCPSESEKITISRWMENGGGVLAMGDHASLGANLCAQIPRVWSMRRWTSEDLAPPRIGSSRVDTNRPMWDSQQHDVVTNPNPETIPFEAQSDDVAQRIDPKRYKAKGRIFPGWRPHPILCGGKLGVINVLPDHPHEGWIKEQDDINLDADILIDNIPDDLEAKEYPTKSGKRPLPEVIAHGNTLPDPPYDHEKSVSPHKKFGVIGAYNGHEIDFGRVVVDSTWHHWMSTNLSGAYEPGFDGDPNVAGNQDLVGLKEANNLSHKKIARYHRNVAIWLAPKEKQRKMLAFVAFWSAFTSRTREDWRLDTPVNILGGEGKTVLGKVTSHCFVSRWIRELLIPELVAKFDLDDLKKPKIDPRDPLGPVCLSCPPDEILEDVVFGTLMKNMMKFRKKLTSSKINPKEFSKDKFEKTLIKVLDSSQEEANKLIVEKLRSEQKQLKSRIKDMC